MRTRHHLDKRSLSPLASLFHRAAALLSALLVAACGNSNWLEVRFVGEDENGPVDETVRLEGASVAGRLGPGEFSAGSGQGVYYAYFSTADKSTYLGNNPLTMLTLGRRVVDFESWKAHPGTGFHPRSDFHGLHGPGLAVAELFHGVSKAYRVGLVDIERWAWTGDPNGLLEVVGKTYPLEQSEQFGVRAEVDFSFRVDCSSRINSATTLCGASGPSEPRTYRAASLEQAPTCPEEVLRPFFGESFQDKPVHMELSHLQVEGASERLDCKLTSDSEVKRMCGKNLEVQADGCKWKASAIASFWQHGLYLRVGARTEPGCREPIHFCSALMTAAHQ